MADACHTSIAPSPQPAAADQAADTRPWLMIRREGVFLEERQKPFRSWWLERFNNPAWDFGSARRWLDGLDEKTMAWLRKEAQGCVMEL